MLLVLFITLVNISCYSQDKFTEIDTAYSHHSPRKALIMSALVPGLGQIYNNKVWKVPILYGGAATSFYFLNYYKARWNVTVSILKRIGDKEPLQEFYLIYGRPIQGALLEEARDYYRKWYNVNTFILMGLYVLNIVDAVVDAYMFEYDISDDLSMEIIPNVAPVAFDPVSMGLTICLKF